MYTCTYTFTYIFYVYIFLYIYTCITYQNVYDCVYTQGSVQCWIHPYRVVDTSISSWIIHPYSLGYIHIVLDTFIYTGISISIRKAP